MGEMTVPPLDLPANFESLRRELLDEITAICASGQYVLGPKVAAFEQALGQYTGAKFTLGVSSGTDALLIALMALETGPGDEVIVPTFTFFGSAGVVARVGARPVLVDIDAETFNIDVAAVERLITPRTKAIMPVHLYGELCDMAALMQLAQRRNIPIIEDACQAIGACLGPASERASAPAPRLADRSESDPTRTRDGFDRSETGPTGMSGTFGVFAALSFYPTKNLGAMGDAGALLCSDAALAEKARLLRTHGENPRYHHRLIGGNFRLDALQAAVLTIKLRHLAKWTQQRRARAARYNELLTAAGLVREFVRTPVERHGRHTYHQYVLRAQRRDELMQHLTQRGIGCGIYYPVPLHMQDCFAYLGHRRGEFPAAERAAAEVIALPMYPELTDWQQQAVVGMIAEFYRPS